MININNFKKIKSSDYRLQTDKNGNLEIFLSDDLISKLNHSQPDEIEYQIDTSSDILSINLKMR